MPTPDKHAPAPIIELGETFQRAFEEITPGSMPADQSKQYREWLEEHPDEPGRFGDRMGAAVEWAKENPESLQHMVDDFDTAVRFLNDTDVVVDAMMFPNIALFQEKRDKIVLPTLQAGEGDPVVNKYTVLRTVVEAAHRLRWGETTKPDGVVWYNWHNFVKSDEGMVAASLVDLYENHTRTQGLYPDVDEPEALIANAITEAAYLTNPNGELFTTLRNPDDGWIKDYPGFSQAFQNELYGQAEHETNSSEIREAKPTDLDELVDFMEKVYADTYPNDRGITRDMFEGNQSFRFHLREYLVKQLADPEKTLFLDVEDDQIVGTIGIANNPFDEHINTKNPDIAELWGFYVDPGKQSVGRGRRLWNMLLQSPQMNKPHPVNSVYLSVAKDSKKAVAFYKQLGFTTVNEEEWVWPHWTEPKLHNQYWKMQRWLR